MPAEGVMGRDGGRRERAEGNDPSPKESPDFPALLWRLPSAYGFMIYKQEKKRQNYLADTDTKF